MTHIVQFMCHSTEEGPENAGWIVLRICRELGSQDHNWQTTRVSLHKIVVVVVVDDDDDDDDDVGVAVL